MMPAIGFRCIRCGQVGASADLLAYCVTATCPRMLVLRCLSFRGWMPVDASLRGVA